MNEEIKNLSSQLTGAVAEIKAKTEAGASEVAELKGTINTMAQTIDKLSKKARNVNLEATEKLSTGIKALAKAITSGFDKVTDEEVKAFSVGVGADGGYMLQPDLQAVILAKVQETSDIRKIANVVSTTSTSVDFPLITGKISSGWGSESAARAASNTNGIFGKATIGVHDVWTQPAVTQTFLNTVSNADQTILDLIAETIALTENTAFVSGTGAGQPLGFLTNTTDSTSFDAANVQFIKSGVDGAVTADKIIELAYTLKSEYKKNAVWLMSKETMRLVRQLKDSTNQYLWEPSLQAGQPSTLLGFPVYEAADMPVPATGSLSIAFGDFKRGYGIVDGVSISILRNPYANPPFVNFYSSKGTGGGVLVAEAIKLLKLAA